MYFTEEELVGYKEFDGDITSFKEYLSNKRSFDVLDSIVESVCSVVNVHPSKILLPTNKRSVVMPRQLAHYFSYYYTTVDIKTIGRRIGFKNHDTVLYSKNTVDNLCESDLSLATVVLNISNSLEAKGIIRIYDKNGRGQRLN